MRALLSPALLLALAGCSSGSLVAAPVTVSIPAAPVATAEPEPPAPAASAEPPPDKPDARITGVWEEEFQGRSGCADRVTIHGTRRNLVIEGKDCNDNAHYQFKDIKYDGTTLRFTLLVGETGYALHYTLHRDGAGMKGRVEIHGPSPSGEAHDIRWKRPD